MDKATTKHFNNMVQRLKNHPDIYKINQEYGTVSVNVHSENAVKEIVSVVNKFFATLNNIKKES